MPGEALRNNDKADGGYFEDLPKLLFILFAVAMFIFSTVTAYGARGQFNERVAMLDELNDFSDETGATFILPFVSRHML